MTKAEQRALEAYPYNRAYTSNDTEYDGNFCNRQPYIEGYEQAERDLVLTGDDIRFIRRTLSELEADEWTVDTIWDEAARIFNEQRRK